MSRPKAKEKFKELLGKIDLEAWETDVDTHCEAVVGKVKSAMQKAFPNSPKPTQRQLQPEALR
eukprot:5572901-Prorocentrum_lima.AAC.1